MHKNTRITELQGEKFLSGVTIKDDTGAEQKILWTESSSRLDGSPTARCSKASLNSTTRKRCIIDINGHTNVPGIFAAGDLTNVKNKQIIIAAGDGAKAALKAFEYLVTQ